jgi:hypothetical protein
MTGLEYLKLGKDIMKNKLISLNGLQSGTNLNGLLNSLEKHYLLMLLNCLWIKLFDVLELAVKRPKSLERMSSDNVRGDEQLAQ